ncbi:chaperone modulator CbpM [uncultured Chitinophaga sp.]|uniref:chaperone modulator CbpM n=1 Tax=uncultured Chitinophaga sp. TaxID=339340 RepID=UPI0025E45E3E|nr:chaperone modulator CbpM [uncultured Chitinophaga sp.]
MSTEMITVREYCLQYETDQSFISALEENGLITVTIVETEPCIHFDDLHSLDTYRSWYYDMNINVEGIDALLHVVNKMKQLQQQVHVLRSRLRLYEDQ